MVISRVNPGLGQMDGELDIDCLTVTSLVTVKPLLSFSGDGTVASASTAPEMVRPPWKEGLGMAAMSYIAIDYLRHLSPTWHARLQPALWSALALVSLTRVPSYRHWSSELRSALPFIASLLFMMSALLLEMLSVRSSTAVLGLDWHRSAPTLPDTGQWLFLALNEKLPPWVVTVLRARIIGLHHYLMLFLMLCFSVLFDSVKAPGLGLGARYMFTMAIARLLRAVSFVSTILPSPRPWCAASRFRVPSHPHPWAQKYYVPYASSADAIRAVIQLDVAFENVGDYPMDHRPDWGSMKFLADFLRPTVSEGSSWFSLLKKAGGGCNDLLYSGHMVVAVLTAMAWTEAYGGWSSALIWLLVLHSGQREIRERHHYTVDCVVAIYVGILLWRISGFLWSAKDSSRVKRLYKFEQIQGKLFQAAKDSDMDKVREILGEVELADQQHHQRSAKWAMRGFAGVTIVSSLIICLLAFTWTSDG